MRMTGVTARGVIMPVFKEGDPLAEMICQNILKASSAENFPIDPPSQITMGVALHSKADASPAVKMFLKYAVRMLTRTESAQ